MFLTIHIALRRIVSISLAISLLACFASTLSTSAATSGFREPARIVFDNVRPALGPDQTIAVRATVLDSHGSEVPGYRISWGVIDDGIRLVDITPGSGLSQTVLLTGLRYPGVRDAFVTLRATIGRVSASILVHYKIESESKLFNHYSAQASEPFSIRLSDKEVDLPVGSKQTITADVYDRYGNRINGANVKWQLANSVHEKFVLLGPQVNSYSVNSLEIAWGAGQIGIKTPSQVPLVAISGSATALVLVNYKPVESRKVKIILDKTDLDVRPGETAEFVIKVIDAETEEILTGKVDPTVELTSDKAKKVINVIGPDPKTHKVTLTGLVGDEKTEPLIPGAVIVRAGGQSASLNVTYHRDPVIVLWDVLPPNIVGDNYGRTIKSDYYGIEVVIENYSGSDLQVAALAFDLNGQIRPNTSYAIVHGSLARRRLTHPRTMALVIISGVGTLMTGFNPFFHNVNRAKNYSTFIDVISNPLEKGLTLAWPDVYPDEMKRLESDAMRDNKIVKNNDVEKVRIFFPKRALFANDDKRRSNLLEVRRALGELKVFGYKFQRGPLQRLQ